MRHALSNFVRHATAPKMTAPLYGIVIWLLFRLAIENPGRAFAATISSVTLLFVWHLVASDD